MTSREWKISCSSATGRPSAQADLLYYMRALQTCEGEGTMRLTNAVGVRVLVICAVVLASSLVLRQLKASEPAHESVQAPRFEVDPLWPKPLPNHWVLGSTIGLTVDSQDHVWIIHRPATVENEFKAATFNPPIGTC